MQNIHLKKIRGECVSRRNGQPLGTARRKCREWVTNSVESVVCVSLRHVSSSRPPDHSRNRCLSAIYTHTHTHTHVTFVGPIANLKSSEGPLFSAEFVCLCVSDWHFALHTFPGQSLSRTDVSRTRRFPERRFPDKTFPVQDLSRTITFPDRRFPDKLYLGIFMYTVCVNTSSIGLVTWYVGIRSIYILMCACRPAVSIRGLFGKACSLTVGKA